MRTEHRESRPAGHRPCRRHSSQFKARVALEALKGQKTLNELANEFGIHPLQITQWKRQLFDASADIFESGSASRSEREQEQLVEQLYQQIGQLKMEVDWLQKRAFHGGQFTNAAYTNRLEHASIQISWDGRGRALDNAFVERLWRSVKWEMSHHK